MGRRSGSEDGPSSIDLRVGRRINLRRAVIGLSQQQLAERLNAPIDDVKAFEGGLSRPAASQVFELCQVLGVTPSWLFYEAPLDDEN